MYSEIMIDDYSSDRMLEKTQKLIKYMMEDYGFTDDEVVQFCIERQNNLSQIRELQENL